MSPRNILERRPPRRALRGKTNYRKRLKLVKSGKPRLVVRRTNKYVIVQIIESRRGGDYTAVTVSTRALRQYGWMGGTKSIPAAYLAGFMAGKLALQKGYSEAIVDLGLHPSHPGSRLYAAVKGALDAGLSIPVGGGVLPPEERIKGQHVADFLQIVRGSGNTTQFHALDPEYVENLPRRFEDVRQKIAQGSPA
ncbi:MAG: 50S ribosomal protein L18 [Nitrososphaerota archaeon]